MVKYNPQKIEKKWQKYWAAKKIYKTKEDKKSPKYYVLDMFPYPSGAGLHVGHPKGYIATDVVARLKMMRGASVLHPMGWDAFGLPAENYAIKNKIHPKTATDKNIKTFKRQLGLLGFTYDWEREINTTDPAYYRWTQWIFLQMFKKGLAYESYEPINWCPECQTGLANEDLEGGKCERCGSEIERKPMRQWVLKITDYADRLLTDLDELSGWPEPIKEMQRNWIGRSEGALVKFSISNFQFPIEVFTTRPDTLFGATYVVLAPEHPLISNLKSQIFNLKEVEEYIKKAKKKSDLERTDLAKEKTGVELKGVKAINPVNKEDLPIFVADYVLGGYGTGAIMAVPAHDERDFEFAKKYNLPIRQVVAPVRIDSKNSPLPGKNTVTRKTVHALVLDKKQNKFLCVKWLKYPWTAFIVGGVDEGEDIVEAARREVREETGYVNLKFIKMLGGTVCGKYFAAHKDENRLALSNAVLFELENDERQKMNPEETAKHEVVWLNADNIRPDNFTCAELDLWFGRIKNDEGAFTEEGMAINSSFLDGLETKRAISQAINWLEKNSLGKKQVQYKLRDWVFSRQRYWGEPIPLVFCENCAGKSQIPNPKSQDKLSEGEKLNPGWFAVPEDELPLELPNVKNYKPTGTGESPLANIKEWVETKCPKCGGPAKRETNTMPQWAGSSWYYLAYTMLGTQNSNPKSQKYKWNQKSIDYWNPVDLYVGGAEHATRHLIYARFWHKFLYDIGAVNYNEPFTRLQNVGLILAEDGRKMSKRWGNVINPDDVVKEFGADAMRMYEMFMGPFDQPCAWSTQGLVGVRRFLDRVWNLQQKVTRSVILSKAKDLDSSPVAQNDNVEILLNQTTKKVTEDIEGLRFNTAVSALMILANGFGELQKIPKDFFEKFVLLVSPFCPHLAEELWSNLGNKRSVVSAEWPQYDPAKIQNKEITIALLVNNKVRDELTVPADMSEEAVKAKAVKSEKAQKWLGGKPPKRVIYVKGRLVNIIV